MSDMTACLNDLSYIPLNNEQNDPTQGDIGETSNEPTRNKRNDFEELYASANEELYPGCDYVTRLNFMAKFTYFKVKESSFILTLLIPGPKSPGKDIDVYLRPLIDDLKDLWAKLSVETIDVATRQKFNMRAMEWMDVPITFRSISTDDVSDEPLIIKADVEGYLVRKVFVDQGAAVQIMFEHCFDNLSSAIKAWLTPTQTELVGFSGEQLIPIGKVELEVKFGGDGLFREVMLKFIVLRASSTYNIILGRTGIRELRVVSPTIHSMATQILRGSSDQGNHRPAHQANSQQNETLYMDKVSSLKEAVLIDPSGTEYTYAIRLTFSSTNNEVEYEALVGLRIARKMKVQALKVKVDSK
nr:reverse transcriptase domain-containing protein [Tanacetum cinerariifolium]